MSGSGTTGWTRSAEASSESVSRSVLTSSSLSVPSRTPGHQFHRPARCMNAGTSTIRMRVASSSTATARPKPRNCIIRTRAKAKAPNTRIMMSAAEVITDAVRRQPLHRRLGVLAGAVVRLLDPAQQEHLVVHAQAEDDGEHHHRHDHEDRRGRAVEPEEPRRPAILEHQHDQPEGGADRQACSSRSP